MSLDVRNNRVALKPSTEQINHQPWSMDDAADRLMDDVFSEVDTMLKSGGELPTEPPPGEYVTMQQIAVPRINVPPTMPERTKTAEAPTPAKAEKPEKSRNSFEKLLLVAACTSLGITLLLWLASSGRLNGLLGASAPSKTVAQKTVSPVDSQFMDYMQRSLDKFDQNAPAPETQSAAPAAQTANAQIPVPALPSFSERPPIVIIREAPRIQYVNPPVPPAASPQANQVLKNRPTVAAAGNIPSPKARSAAPTPMSRPESKSSRTVTPVEAPRPTALGVLIGPPLPSQITASRPPIPQPLPRSVATAGIGSAPAPSPRAIAAARPAPAPAPSPRATTAARPAPAPAPSPRATTAARPAPTPAALPRATTAARPEPAPAPSPRATAAARRATSAPTSTSATASSVQPTPRAESTQAAAPQPAIRHILRGVMKSEDSSKDAALFEVNGVTRRVAVGESVSSSGWTLVEIKNGEAVIRRNGEVRSIYAEQEF